MPLGFLKHNNLSKQNLNDIAVLGSATPSTGGSAEDLEPGQARNPHHPRSTIDSSDPYILQTSTPGFERRPYQTSDEPPSRSQSTRRPSQKPQPYPSSSRAPQPQAGSFADDLDLESRRLQQQGRKNTNTLQQPPPPNVEQKEKKGFFGRIRGNKPPEQNQHSRYNNTTGLSRSLSKKETFYKPTPTQRERLKEVGYQGGKDKIPPLLAQSEGVEDDSPIDPFLIRDPEQQHVQGRLSQHSIRAVQDEVEPAKHSGKGNRNGDVRQHYQQQLQHPQDPTHYRPQDTAQESRYHHPLPDLPQDVNNQPGRLITNDHVGQLQSSETNSQVSYESPTDPREESRPISVQSNGQSPTVGYLQRDPHDRTPPAQTPRSTTQQTMPPANQGSQQRRSADAKQTLQTQPDTREGQSFQQQQQYRNQPTTPAISPHPSNVSSQNYRGGPPQRDQYGASGGGDQGRHTPPPASSEQNVADAFKDLCELKSIDLKAGY